MFNLLILPWCPAAKVAGVAVRTGATGAGLLLGNSRIGGRPLRTRLKGDVGPAPVKPAGPIVPNPWIERICSERGALAAKGSGLMCLFIKSTTSLPISLPILFPCNEWRKILLCSISSWFEAILFGENLLFRTLFLFYHYLFYGVKEMDSSV